jgi:menaquinone-dependent protoporphyrinogen oxidase
VVIGSALYTGHWLDPAVEFIERNCDALARRPVWLFSSGPVGDPAGRLAGATRRDPVEIAPIEAVLGARGHRIFAGRLDAKGLSRGQRASLLVFRGLEGDFRDWEEIRQWARMIADELSGATTMAAAS